VPLSARRVDVSPQGTRVKRYLCLLVVAVAVTACDGRKPSPVAPTDGSQPATSPTAAPAVRYPTNGPDLIAYVAAKYPERLVGGISRDQRIQNMQYLRDRIIEAGKCGGMDLGWNLKRGGPEVSNDFIVERLDGVDYGHDIASDYDNTSHPLQLYWGGGSFPAYREYPAPACD
jgi:hypothetical protein